MKITQLIQLFEEALITYEKAVNEKWSYETCVNHWLQSGLCRFIWGNYNILIFNLFDKGSYFCNFSKPNGYIGPIMIDTFDNKPLKLRIKFLKQQIPELKKLLEQGYTDV